MLRQAIITGVRNPTHLVHISSYLRTLLDERCQRLVVRWSDPERSIARFGRLSLDPTVVSRWLPDDPRLELDLGSGAGRWRFPSDHWATHLAVGRAGLRPYAAMLAANPGRTPHVVVIDDGLASYGEPTAWLDDGSVRRPRNRPGALGRAVVELGHRAIAGDRWALYTRTATRWQVDEQVAAEFRRRLGEVPVVDPDRVVVLSQPRGQVGPPRSRAEERDRVNHQAHIRRLVTRVRAEGKQVVVRPHPMEDPRAYDGLDVIAGVGPAELDPAVVSAAEVIGEPSTTLVNLAALYGRRARLVAPPVTSGAPVVLSQTQAELVRTFVDDPDLTCTEPMLARPVALVA